MLTQEAGPLIEKIETIAEALRKELLSGLDDEEIAIANRYTSASWPISRARVDCRLAACPARVRPPAVNTRFGRGVWVALSRPVAFAVGFVGACGHRFAVSSVSMLRFQRSGGDFCEPPR